MANTNTFNQAGWTFDEALMTFNGDVYTPSNPAQEGRQIVLFTAAGQKLNCPFIVYGLLWVSDELAPISAGQSLEVLDLDGNRIAGKEARGDGDGLKTPFYRGKRVNGVMIGDLDGGYLYVYGERI